MGILDYLERKWFPTHTECEMEQTTAAPVSLGLVLMMFVMAACSLVVAAISLVLECFVHRRQHQSDRSH